jgi:hypothetical protein
VKDAFYLKQKLANKNLKTDGNSLWSYGWWEIARWVRGEVVLRTGPPYSHTTLIFHMKGLKGIPAKKQTPMSQANMNV